MAEDLEKLKTLANDFYYKNDYAHAMELFEKIIKIDTTDYKNFEKMAKIEVARSNFNKAIEYYEKCLSLKPEDEAICNDLGNIYFDLSNFSKAIEYYKKAAKEDPQFYWAHYNIGLALRRGWPDNSAKRNESEKWLNNAIKIKPDYHPALNELGLYYMDKGDYNQAETYFFRTLKACKAYKYPYCNLALIYKEREQKEKAKEFFYRALQYAPDYVAALNNLGILYYDDDDLITALYYYTRALETDPGYKYALHNIGLVFDRMGQFAKAYEMQSKTLSVAANYKPASEEKARLQREHSAEIKNQEGICKADLKSSTYEKDMTKIQIKESLDIETGLKQKQKEAQNQELYLEKFGRNITKMAREGKLFSIVGREKEIRSLLEILFNIKKNNPILVGKAGVGKTAIVEGLAQRIVSGNVPEYFKNMEVVEINMGLLVAGTKFRGEFEERLKKIIDELKKRQDLILFIDEFHTVLGAGTTVESSLDAANILKPALSRGELHCIGATTTAEYKKYVEKDKALARRFYKITVEELNPQSTLDLLKKLKLKMEEHYKITIASALLELIVTLAEAEIKNRVFPDKAIDILENSFSRAALAGQKEVDELTIRNIIGEFVGIKFLETEEDRGRQLLNLEKYLRKRIYGQDQAIEQIAKIVRLTKKKLDLKPYQPDGIFFFAGPTGVGKTYLAKQLANFLYGSDKKLFILNMSEFTESHSVAKLIGSPPGYVGYNEVSYFHKNISENPSSLLLLDEIEKAHPEVLKLLLQVFDEGKITDSQGNNIYFANVTIIMTSNAFSVSSSHLGFSQEAEKPSADLTTVFAPEFVNRIDQVIIFNSIDKKTARKILTDLIMKNAISIFDKRGITIEFNSTFVDYILQQGYSKEFGVRNLERVFEKEVMAAVAHYLFQNTDATKVIITTENGRVQVC